MRRIWERSNGEVAWRLLGALLRNSRWQFGRASQLAEQACLACASGEALPQLSQVSSCQGETSTRTEEEGSSGTKTRNIVKGRWTRKPRWDRTCRRLPLLSISRSIFHPVTPSHVASTRRPSTDLSSEGAWGRRNAPRRWPRHVRPYWESRKSGSSTRMRRQ